MKWTLTLAIAACAAISAGCGSSKQIQRCPETEPVTIEVPVPIADGSRRALSEWIGRQTPPTTLTGLGDSTSTATIAKTALTELGWYKLFYRDLVRFLAPVSDNTGTSIVPQHD